MRGIDAEECEVKTKNGNWSMRSNESSTLLLGANSSVTGRWKL